MHAWNVASIFSNTTTTTEKKTIWLNCIADAKCWLIFAYGKLPASVYHVIQLVFHSQNHYEFHSIVSCIQTFLILFNSIHKLHSLNWIIFVNFAGKSEMQVLHANVRRASKAKNVNYPTNRKVSILLQFRCIAHRKKNAPSYHTHYNRDYRKTLPFDKFQSKRCIWYTAFNSNITSIHGILF